MQKIFYSPLFYFMLCHFILMVVLFILNFKYLLKEFKKINKKILIILFLIFLLGFYLRNSEYWLGPFIDGYVYQESAHMWLLHGKFVKSCALGNQIDCNLFEQVLFLPGFPFIIALVFLLFGINSIAASVVSAVLSSLTIILVFFISYLLFKKAEAGLWAALVYALIPINILYSQTGLSRPAGLFFLGSTIVFYLLSLKNNKIITWMSFVVFLSFTIYIRQEVYILIPFFLIFFLIYRWEKIKLISKNIFLKFNFLFFKDFFFLGLFFVLLQLPALNWLLFNNPLNSVPGGGFLGLQAVGIVLQGKALLLQLLNITSFSYHIHHYFFSFSLVFFSSFFILFFYYKKEYFFIWILFLLILFINSLFTSGVPGGLTSDYFRRSLMLNLPYAIITGFGLYMLNPFNKKNYYFSIVTFFIVVNLFLLIIFSYDYSPDKLKSLSIANYNNFRSFFTSTLFRDIRADKNGERSLVHPKPDFWRLAEKIPNDSLIITSRGLIFINDYFENNNRKIAQTDLIHPSTEKLFLEEIKNSNNTFYIKDYQCDPPYDKILFLCEFINEKLDQEFYFEQDPYIVYRVNIK